MGSGSVLFFLSGLNGLGQRVIGHCLSSKDVCFDCLTLAGMARPLSGTAYIKVATYCACHQRITWIFIINDSVSESEERDLACF